MKIKEFFTNHKVAKIFLKAFLILGILFLIFFRFVPLIKKEEELVSLFSLPLYYNLDVILLSANLVLIIINFILNNKYIFYISLIILIISLIIFIVSFSLTNIILGIFILLIIFYIFVIFFLFGLKS